MTYLTLQSVADYAIFHQAFGFHGKRTFVGLVTNVLFAGASPDEMSIMLRVEQLDFPGARQRDPAYSVTPRLINKVTVPDLLNE
jgi:hypothetical protein